MDALDQMNQSKQEIPNAFKVTKNIPIDVRYIVSKVENIDTEIPLNLRYPGLQFFIIEETDNSEYTGDYYFFNTDLETYQKLADYINSKLKYVTLSGEETFSDYLTILNSRNYQNGETVYLTDLHILVVKDGNDWKYLSGEYYLSSITDWNEVPTLFKKQNVLAFSVEANYHYLIANDLTLKEKVLVSSTNPTSYTNFHYYKINGILYYYYNALYRVGVKFTLKEKDLIIGTIEVTHNLNSIYIFGYLRLSYGTVHKLIPLELDIIDANNISFESSIILENQEVILFANT